MKILPRLGVSVAALLLGGIMLLVTHLPFYLDASRRGFAPEFLGQYTQWPAMIAYQGGRLMGVVVKSTKAALVHPENPVVHPEAAASGPPAAIPQASAKTVLLVATPAAAAVNAVSKETQISAKTQPRRSLTAATPRDRMLAINLYLPILISALLAAGATGGWLVALFRRDEKTQQTMLLLLTCLGCSLALFPQYFFWRPDMVHLSEFMVPMTLTLLISCFAAVRSWVTAGLLLRIGLGIYALIAALTLLLYYINACQSQSSGGIAASVRKSVEFHGANGVSVKLTPEEFQDTSAMYRIITAVSAPGEYLICYPYNPEINFMTGRPSYEYNFYVDNAMVSPEQFHKETLEKIGKYHPVVFVISNWEINNTEESQFKNWASRTYDYIASNYTLAYRRGITEVFVRKDRESAIPLIKSEK